RPPSRHHRARRSRRPPRRRPRRRRGHPRRAARHQRPVPVGARGDREDRRDARGGAAVRGGPPAAVSEEDRLDRDQARHVMSRAAAMTRPYRREVWKAVFCITAYTASILAGPYLVKWAIDSGLTPPG